MEFNLTLTHLTVLGSTSTALTETSTVKRELVANQQILQSGAVTPSWLSWCPGDYQL